MSSETKSHLINGIKIVLAIYLFLLSIELLGHSFKMFGKDFAIMLIETTSNPFAGLIIGIVATSLIQSSSTTTSIVVGLVAGGALNLPNAIPIIMGANIGTTITNTLVSLGHVGRSEEFERAFGASIVHDIFNVSAVIVLFPIELIFHPIATVSTALEEVFAGMGGLKMFDPLKYIIDPVIDLIDQTFKFMPYESVFLLILSLAVIIGALIFLVKTIRSMVLTKLEMIINEFLFRNDLVGLGLGAVLTLIVQSSSVTTSLIVPLAGAGVISIRQIFPYTLGANIGTTGTAILAALATQNDIAVTAAFAHLCFNIFGILIFYPLKFIPIKSAEYLGRVASKSTRNLVTFVVIYILLHFVPVVLIFLT